MCGIIICCQNLASSMRSTHRCHSSQNSFIKSFQCVSTNINEERRERKNERRHGSSTINLGSHISIYWNKPYQSFECFLCYDFALYYHYKKRQIDVFTLNRLTLHTGYRIWAWSLYQSTFLRYSKTLLLFSFCVKTFTRHPL